MSLKGHLGGLPGLLYLWLLILSLHTYMASLVSAMLTVQKMVTVPQVCLALGHCPHQSGCRAAGNFSWLFEQGNWEPLAHPALTLQHGICLGVMTLEDLALLHFQVERLVSWKCLTSQSKRMKD